jgi:hypothetical protein
MSILEAFLQTRNISSRRKMFRVKRKSTKIGINRKYEKQDQQGKAAFNARRKTGTSSKPKNREK